MARGFGGISEDAACASPRVAAKEFAGYLRKYYLIKSPE
jgi:hypothetical protein